MKLAIGIFALVMAAPVWAGPLTGSYIVPAPAELASVSALPTEYEVTTGADGKLKLKYCLPEELTGSVPYHVELDQQGPAGEWVSLTSPVGDSARCSVTSESLTCFVLYPRLTIDQANVSSLLKTKYLGSSTLPLREQLAELFGNDPKGVVSVSLK